VTGSALLLSERLVQAQPSVVRAFGLLQAVVLQQIAWHLDAAEHGEWHDDEEWFPVTCSDLASEIGVSEAAIGRATRSLEERRVLLSVQPEGWSTRRKWYRIDRDHEDLVPLPQSTKSKDRNRRNRRIGTDDSVASPSSTVEALETPADAAPAPSAPKVSARRRTAAEKSEDDTRADKLTRDWWESRTPRPTPAGGFVAVRKIVLAFVRAGWSDAQLAAALTSVATVANWSLEEALRRGTRGRPGVPEYDRSAPTQRIAL